jgi:hypothetical protein
MNNKIIKDISLQELEEEKELLLKEINFLQLDLTYLKNTLNHLDVKIKIKKSSTKFTIVKKDTNG